MEQPEETKETPNAQAPVQKAAKAPAGKNKAKAEKPEVPAVTAEGVQPRKITRLTGSCVRKDY